MTNAMEEKRETRHDPSAKHGSARVELQEGQGALLDADVTYARYDTGRNGFELKTSDSRKR
jgi:hypothetical protein